MQQAARYLFDLDFAAPAEPEIEEEIEEIPPEPMITVAEHERLLEEAVAAARAEGEATAMAQREQLASEKSLHLQQTMLDEIAMIYTEVGILLERLEKDASNLAFAFASRFAERLVAQEPKTEILALLHQILAPLRKTPHISIRLNDAVADEIKAMVEGQMSELGFSGKLTIIPDPAIMAGDCEVEWADGGIGRNLRSAIRQVDQLLEDHFAHIPDQEDEEEEGEDEQTNADEEATAESGAEAEASQQDQSPAETASQDTANTATANADDEADQTFDLKGEANPEPTPVEQHMQQGQADTGLFNESSIGAEANMPRSTDKALNEPTSAPEMPASTGSTQMETHDE